MSTESSSASSSPASSTPFAHLSVPQPASINPGLPTWLAVDAVLEQTLLTRTPATLAAASASASASSSTASQAAAAADPATATAVQPSTPPFSAFLDRQSAAGINPINVSPAQGAWLAATVAASRSSSVLEIGTLGGYSAAWLALGLRIANQNNNNNNNNNSTTSTSRRRRIVSLELDPAIAAVARENLAEAGFLAGAGNDGIGDACVEIRVGNARDSLKELVAAGEVFDFVFIDADKESYPDYLAAVLQLTRVGSVIVADNIVRRGEVANPDTTDSRVQGVQRFLDLLGAQQRLFSTAVQTVGAKGYDGFSMSV
ncbi:S-adenosyl-L-methionine-dependent methyltransferase, partial [Zopfochytrium polystomum]